MPKLPPTPYYLIDETKLERNLKIIKRVRDESGAKSVLALKCFSTWSVFPLMKKYLDGTTSSSLYEAKLGHEKFGKETHAYSVAFSRDEVRAVSKFADKIIFNSAAQLQAFHKDAKGLKIGLRVNPHVSYSHFDLANPARKYSRLGVAAKSDLKKAAKLVSGLMFHFNCENDDFTNLASNLEQIGRNFGGILKDMEWVSLGGGIAFTNPGYPLDQFCKTLKDFARTWGVQVYLEPGEAAITWTTELVTSVLDVMHHEKDIAIVDSSIEGHMLDLLIYRTPAKMEFSGKGRYEYMVAGRSCLAGDVFGTFRFQSKLKPGSVIRIADAAGYTMVKKNWFNGLQMPSIVVKRLGGKLDVIRNFEYKDYLKSLS
ncbi:MAG: carboxynorspermidine decarboxylase [Spirochaetia bacterium]|nr:carboxynorspermidine decarboxylase [Spirochaetia bacterium]